MATIVWDSKWCLLIDYKFAGTSIKKEYNVNAIKQLRVAIKEKQSGPLATGVHLCMVMPLCTRPELHKRLFLSASRNLKSDFWGTRFRDDDKVNAST